MKQKQQAPALVGNRGRNHRDGNRCRKHSREAQRARLLAHLKRHGTVSTIEARRDLDVLHPAGRVLELRRRGYPIVTGWICQATPEGHVHRIGRYYLAGVLND